MIIVTFSDLEEQVVEKIKAALAEDQEIEKQVPKNLPFMVESVMSSNLNYIKNYTGFGAVYQLVLPLSFGRTGSE